MKMKFNEKTVNEINDTLVDKKRENPVSRNVLGIGVNLRNSIDGSGAYLNNWQICKIDDLARIIEELTMLKEAIEEETGLEL